MRAYIDTDILIWHLRGKHEAQDFLNKVYQSGEYDVAGSIVGIVEKSKVIQGEDIQKGDVLVGLPSTGLHTNGYSLARKVLFEAAGLSVHDRPKELDKSIGETLLQVHRCYLPVVDPLLDSFPIKGMSHITGGGIVGNTRRILPEGRSLKINWSAWEIPPIFRLIQKLGRVSDKEMRKSFNLGIGFIFIVRKSDADSLMERLTASGECPILIGEVV